MGEISISVNHPFKYAYCTTAVVFCAMDKCTSVGVPPAVTVADGVLSRWYHYLIGYFHSLKCNEHHRQHLGTQKPLLSSTLPSAFTIFTSCSLCSQASLLHPCISSCSSVCPPSPPVAAKMPPEDGMEVEAVAAPDAKMCVILTQPEASAYELFIFRGSHLRWPPVHLDDSLFCPQCLTRDTGRRKEWGQHSSRCKWVTLASFEEMNQWSTSWVTFVAHWWLCIFACFPLILNNIKWDCPTVSQACISLNLWSSVHTPQGGRSVASHQ